MSNKPFNVTPYVGAALTIGAVAGGAAIVVYGLNSPLGQALRSYMSTFASAVGGLLDSPLSTVAGALVVMGVGGVGLYALVSYLKGRNAEVEAMTKINQADAKTGNPVTFTKEDFARLDTTTKSGAQTTSAAVTAVNVAMKSDTFTQQQRAALMDAEIAVNTARSMLVATLNSKSATVDELKRAREDFMKADKVRYDLQRKILGE